MPPDPRIQPAYHFATGEYGIAVGEWTPGFATPEVVPARDVLAFASEATPFGLAFGFAYRMALHMQAEWEARNPVTLS